MAKEPMTKDERREWFTKKLDSLNVPSHGRATVIRKSASVSHAVAAGWLKGSLPKEMHSAFLFCDHYSIDPWDWVYGEPRTGGKTNPEIEQAYMMARKFEKEMGELTDDQFKAVSQLLLTDSVDAAFVANNLSSMASILKMPSRSEVNGGEK